ncbi:MAG: hypothetical protein IT168_22295 [Bryobacterales bacterium]|nr:hypothetical protein [Bryobacterales bacterium]
MTVTSQLKFVLLGALAAGAGYGQTAIDLRTQSKSVDFSAASSTRPIKTGTAMPSNCTVGDMFFKTDAAAGSNLYGCSAANTWTLQSAPATITAANFSVSFTSQSAVTVAHNLNTVNVLVQCYDTGSTALEYSSMTVTNANQVLVNFLSPQSGRCVVNGAGGTSGGGASGGEANTGANAGAGGQGLYYQKFGTELQFKNLNTASNKVSLANDTTNREVDIDVVPGNIDIATLGGSLTLGQISSAAKQGNGSKIQLFGGGTVATNDCAKFDANGNIVSAGAACGSGTGGGSGEVNTASSQGVGGVGVYLQKQGVDLQFKSINAGSSRVTVTNDATNKEVDVDVVPANLDLAAIGGSLSATQIAGASKQGTGTKVQMFTGTAPAANDCAKFDANGNIVTAGAACGSGSGTTYYQTLQKANVAVTQRAVLNLIEGPGVTITTSDDSTYNRTNVTITSTAAQEPLGLGLRRQAGLLEIEPGAVPSYQMFVKDLDFAQITQNTCLEMPITVTGAMTGDRVAPAWPHTLDAGLIGIMMVTAQNTVTVRLCKVTTGTVDPISLNYGGYLLKSF